MGYRFRTIAVTMALLMVHVGIAQESGGPEAAFDGKWTGITWPPIPDYKNLPFSEEGLAVIEAYDHDTDPILKCLFDFGRMTTVSFPMEIITKEHQVTILYEYGHQVRRIFLDRTDFAGPYPPSLMGYSIGNWDGDTLVVETSKILEGWVLMEGGVPFSEKTVVTERYNVDDTSEGKILNIEFTYDDPVYFTEPWSFAIQYKPSDFDIFPYDCTVGSVGSEL